MTALTREQLGWQLVPIWKPAKGQVEKEGEKMKLSMISRCKKRIKIY